MKRKFSIAISILLVFAMLMGMALPAAASSTQDLQKEIQQLQKQLDSLGQEKKDEEVYQKTLNQQIDALNEQLDDYQAQLDSLNQQEADQTTQIMRLDEEISSKNAYIDQKNQEIAQKQAEVDQTMDELKKSMRTNYMNGSTSWLDALLGSEDFGSFISNLEYTKRVAQHDQELKDKLDEQMASLDADKKVVEDEAAQLQGVRQSEQDKLNEVESTKSQIASVQNDIQSTANAVNAKLGESEDKSKQLSQNYQQTQAKQNQAEKELAEAQAAADQDLNNYINNNGAPSNNPASSSGFICPLPAGSYHISQPYGGSHTGVDMAAPKGTPIYASKSGTVVTAQHWDGHSTGGMQSYGNMVQIMHDDGSSTLYAHCSSINVSVGQRVSQGQVIGYVGSTGNSSGNHLHFEMKIDGKRVNPLNYI